MQVIIGWFSGTYIELIIRWVNMTKRKHISGISWFITPSKSSDVITTRPTLNQDPNQLSYIWGGAAPWSTADGCKILHYLGRLKPCKEWDRQIDHIPQLVQDFETAHPHVLFGDPPWFRPIHVEYPHKGLVSVTARSYQVIQVKAQVVREFLLLETNTTVDGRNIQTLYPVQPPRPQSSMLL